MKLTLTTIAGAASRIQVVLLSSVSFTRYNSSGVGVDVGVNTVLLAGATPLEACVWVAVGDTLAVVGGWLVVEEGSGVIVGVSTCTERVVVTSTGCCASEVAALCDNERGREVRRDRERFDLLTDGQYSDPSQ